MKKLTKTEIQKRWDALQLAKQAYRDWGQVVSFMAETQDDIKTKAGTFRLIDNLDGNKLKKFVFIDRYEVQFKKAG